MLDHEGKEVPGNRGYKYFGAAKDLPGNITFCNIFRNYSTSDRTEIFKNTITDFNEYFFL